MVPLQSRLSICAAGGLLLLAQFSYSESDSTHIHEPINEQASRPGQRVANFLPTALTLTTLCQAVGEGGRVYAITLPDVPAAPDVEGCRNIVATTLKKRNFPSLEGHSDSDDPGWVYDYMTTRRPIESFTAPEPLDLIWISERYGELKTTKFGLPNMRWVNEGLFAALKIGGELLVEEASVDANRVKKDMSAVGFEFVTEHVRESDGRILLKFRKSH